MSRDSPDCQVIRVTPELQALQVHRGSRAFPVFRDIRVTQVLPALQAHRVPLVPQALPLFPLKLLLNSVSP